MKSVAVVSPGLLPIPPILGGSVEVVMQKMAEVTKKSYAIDIFGPANSVLPARESREGINYFRFPAKPYAEYFQRARAEINKKEYSLIQVENRPLFIPRTKAANPKSKFICSLHSLDHIAPNLIGYKSVWSIFRLCDRVLVYSRFVRDRLRLMFPDLADRFQFIHLATQEDLFRPKWEPLTAKRVLGLKKSIGIPKDYRVVLFAGRIIPKKGVNVLIKAMAKTIREYPNCCLLVVGSSWFGNQTATPYIRELRKQASELGSRVRFTNYIPQVKLPLYFALADIFVCPSQWDEPFGLVNVEAMAAGVPVVASARGGIPEIITDGKNGLLVKKEKDADKFAQTMLKLLRDQELADKLGRSGRKTVEEYFNWERAGRQLSELYEKVLGTLDTKL